MHWALLASVVAAWATADSLSLAHEAPGYAALAIVVLRAVSGRILGPHARFSGFVRGPRETLAYARDVAHRRARRYLGHNPLGAWMVVALLSTVAAVSVTGALFTTDWLWGYAWLAALHEGLAWLLVALAIAHVLGVVHASWTHRENLVAAMVTGRKRPPAGGDVA
jgi:cytochrome b